jgi:hypothetical protein
MEQFNPSLRNFIAMGKNYEKALAGKAGPAMAPPSLDLRGTLPSPWAVGRGHRCLLLQKQNPMS